MKLKVIIQKSVLIVLFLVIFAGVKICAAEGVPIYRLYHRGTGEHLYTSDYNESVVLSTRHGWTNEGVGWTAPNSGKGVYRLYNPALNDHLYTMDTNETRILTSGRGWRYDFGGKPLFYSGGTVPVYRLYNSTTRRHHLTKDSNEYNVLKTKGWTQEGVSLYGLGENTSSQPTTPTTVRVTGVSLSEHSLSLKVGGSRSLSATVSPSNATNKNVSWSSSNSSVASVSNGYVTARSAGSAEIKVTTSDGNKTDTCRVTVEKDTSQVSGVRLNTDERTMIVGETYELKATVEPETASQTVNWSSSDSSVVSVDKNGALKALKTGTATITATAGGYKATCLVTVKENVENAPNVTEARDFEDFSKKAAELIKNNQVEGSEEIEAADPYFAKRLIVKVKGDLDTEDLGAKAVLKGPDNIYVLQFDSSAKAKEADQKLNSNPNVIYSDADSFEGTEEVSKESVDSKSWGVDKIGADKLAAVTSTSSQIKVAVVDSGIDAAHPFLSGRVAPGGYDFVDNDSDPDDLQFHGTHVSGTIVDCTPGLDNVKILGERVLDEEGSGSSLNVGLGIRHAVQQGAKVINMSLGGKHNDYKEDSIKYAIENNVMVVVSAGNDMEDTRFWCPADMTEAVVVSAVDSKDRLAYFSNFGATVDVAAPGVDIVSSIPGGSFSSLDGTSMAAPHVSAVAAMLTLNNPGSSAKEIERQLTTNVRDLGSSGRDDRFGYGIPDYTSYGKKDPEKIVLDRNSITLQPGETQTLRATITPEDATNKDVTWSSDNSRVATVSGGLVRGITEGSTVIHAKTYNGLEATCSVEVKKNETVPTGVSITPNRVTFSINDSTKLQATVTPSEANQSVVWTVQNNNIAVVNSSGQVTGKETGTTTITAETVNGLKATCTIVVDENTSIYTPEQFYNIKDPSGNYVLKNDIDLSRFSPWEPIGEYIGSDGKIKATTFRGSLDGNGHTITGLKMSRSITMGDQDRYVYYYYGGLFSRAENARFKNVKVSGNYTLTIDPPGNFNERTILYIGGLCGEANSTSFDSCENRINISCNVLERSKYFENDRVDLKTGGIAGEIKGSSTVSNCSNYGAITTNNTNRDSDNFIGGMAGESYNVNFTRCHNYAALSARGTSSNWSVAFVGGIVGQAEKTNFELCVNSANHLAENPMNAKSHSGVGGICAWAVRDCTDRGCENYGNSFKVKGDKVYTGDIYGNKSEYITFN